MDTSEGMPSALAAIESQELEELNSTFRNVTNGVAEVAGRLKDHAKQLDQLKESTARLRAEKDRARFLDACMISMLGVLLEQALKYTGEEVFDMPASEAKGQLLELFPPAFFQALKDDDIEFRPAYRIIQGAKAVKHLRTKETHGRSFRTPCLEVLVTVGKIGTRRANGILASVPIDYLHD
ncbi:hypothetical protein JCM10296v2_006092 [Rhodotorula toruloides]